MKVEIVFAFRDQASVFSVDVPAGATLREAVMASGVLERHPEISLEKQAYGIFGKRAALEARLAPGDRGGDLPAAGDGSEGSAPAARREPSDEKRLKT